MSPETPGSPDQGNVPKGTDEANAELAKQELAAEQADQAAEAPQPEPEPPAASEPDDAPAEKPAAKPAAAKKASSKKKAASKKAAKDDEEAEATAEDVEEAAEEAEEAVAEAGDDDGESAPARKRRRGSRGGSGRKRGDAEKPAKAAEPVSTEKTAPSRRRDARRPAEKGLLVRAQAKYVRTSARKARLVCDHIRGKDVEEARAILAFTPRAVSEAWSKLLESAIANAEHNHDLLVEDLRIHSVWADEGPTLKRFRPRAMGRATRIRKRTSHLTIALTPKE